MKRGKNAQSVFGMSFGVIFSIILIVFILVVGFIVIRSIIKNMDCAKIGLFKDDFKAEINSAWNSAGNEYTFTRNIPTSLEYVCFADLSQKQKGEFKQAWEEISFYGGDYNLFFYPAEKSCDMASNKIAHLNMEKITENKNPYCIPVKNGKVEIGIEMKSDERLVRVK